MLYQLVRCLLDLLAVLERRDLGKDAELLALRHQNVVLPPGLPRALHACRPGVTGRLIAVGATSPLGRDFPGYSGPRSWPGTAGSSDENGTTPHAANQDGHPPQRALLLWRGGRKRHDRLSRIRQRT
jgi:hypothetical protein